MKMKITALLPAFLALSVAACSGVWHTTFEPEESFAWEVMPGGHAVRIVRFDGAGRFARIPPRIGGLPVTHIGDSAFAGRRLTGATIPFGVTFIGNSAFANNQLSDITIPSSVFHIGDSAFVDNRLASLLLPSSIEWIGESAFASNELFSVSLPLGDFHIGAKAFADNRLADIAIPDGANGRIGVGAFVENPLTEIALDDGIFSIHGNAFGDSLRTVTRIRLGTFVNLLGDEYVAWRLFRTAYEANGARAGVYRLEAGVWVFEP